MALSVLYRAKADVSQPSLANLPIRTIPFVRAIAEARGRYHLRVHPIGLTGGSLHYINCRVTFGVYVSPDSGAHWFRIDFNLPHSEIYLLQYNPTTNSVDAATHGRGVWQLQLPDSSSFSQLVH